MNSTSVDNDYPDYHLATNKAYETLIKFKIFSFPITIVSVLRRMHNVCFHSYSEAAEMMGISFTEFWALASSDFGFSVRNSKRNQIEIFYNDHKSESVQRFTLAHELGHVVLEHVQDGKKEDREANCFARNYLCPVPVVQGYNLKTSAEYCKTFFVSDVMANTALVFKNADLYNISDLNYVIYNGGVMKFNQKPLNNNGTQ